MYSQVVEEVVPLAEEHATLLVIALKDLDLAHSKWVLVLKHAEMASAWNCLVDFNRT